MIDTTEAPDGELARRVMARSGRAREAAEAELVRRFHRRVVLYGMRHLRDDDRAHDLGQQVMLRVIERLRAGEVRDPDRIGSFILGTARMMARDLRRSASRQERIVRLAEIAAEWAVTPEPLDHDALAAHLNALPERERSVVTLTFFGQRSAQQIAEVFRTSVGNVRVIRHRALARLRAAMHSEEDPS